MIERDIAPKVKEALAKYPIVAVTGPRQSGKTTLCKMLFPHYRYVNLEDISLRQFAKIDPKGFLETYQGGVIIDEIQYVPDLFSYLQVYTDQRNKNGEYLITGSQNFLMLEKITQSLAGRISIFNLLPFSFSELSDSDFTLPNWEEYLLYGSYPRKWLNKIDATDFYENYIQTYVERDVRLIKNILDLDLFQKFIFLLAGRVGQAFNQSSLGVELGLDNKTINAWMTLLEVSFIAFRLKPYYNNFNKRVIKTPKVYFYDTGLLAFLLGIRDKPTLDIHYSKGALFENMVLLERIKHAWNTKTREKFYFWRDTRGNEVDILIEDGVKLTALEVKSGKTIHKDFFKGLNHFKGLKPDADFCLVYGGTEVQQRKEATVTGFNGLVKSLKK
jgi:predicted AAA+ superfamily ATPase